MSPDSRPLHESEGNHLRVLWLVSAPLPEASRLFGSQETPFGGWLVGSAASLRGTDVRLTIAHVSAGTRRESRSSSTASFVALPNSGFEGHLAELICELQPDVLHVHGTEWHHALTAVQCAQMAGTPSVVSLQGLLSQYSQHYLHGIPAVVRYGFTPRDFARRTNPELGRRDFLRRGKRELDLIRQADYVVGRTEWDQACVTQADPTVRYLHCDEVLRPSFYETSWSLGTCRAHSIFVSQGGYPLKGLHRALQALPTILREFPDAHLYVAGADPTHRSRKLGLWRVGSYGLYIRWLIAKLDLREAVTFLGVQDEGSFRDRLLESNVFVLPSSIENSPNSLAEAMLVGVPAVSSFVGGVPSMLEGTHGVTLYQSDAPYMLAEAVLSIFRDGASATRNAANAQGAAAARHSAERHSARLRFIYAQARR